MTSLNDITNPQLRAAILAAVDMFMAQEAEATRPPAAAHHPSGWRSGALKKPATQPNLWRSVGQTYTQHMGARR